MGQPKYKRYPTEGSGEPNYPDESPAATKHKISKLRKEIEENLQNPDKLTKAIEILLNWNKK